MSFGIIDVLGYFQKVWLNFIKSSSIQFIGCSSRLKSKTATKHIKITILENSDQSPTTLINTEQGVCPGILAWQATDRPSELHQTEQPSFGFFCGKPIPFHSKVPILIQHPNSSPKFVYTFMHIKR